MGSILPHGFGWRKSRDESLAATLSSHNIGSLEVDVVDSRPQQAPLRRFDENSLDKCGRTCDPGFGSIHAVDIVSLDQATDVRIHSDRHDSAVLGACGVEPVRGHASLFSSVIVYSITLIRFYSCFVY